MNSISQNQYLRVGNYSDLTKKSERIIYRIFEMIPAVLSWSTLILAFLLSIFQPIIVALFIIFFAILWFLKTIYFSFHLRSAYAKMKEHENENWLGKLASLEKNRISPNLPSVEGWRDIYHLVVFPMYEEPFEIVKEAFLALENSDYPKDRFIAVLACEEKKKQDVEKIASRIEKEFASKFFKFLITWHPENIPGEIAGKGSNETWSLKRAKEKIIDPLAIPYENVVVSSFDVDTCVYSKYFSCLSYHFLTAPNPARASFQPIPLYINNIWQAPVISRVFSFSSTFWHTMNQERPEKLITFSSHSMSMKALDEVGFKQTNVVSDDSRIFWQCFLKFDGDYAVIPLFYPISMDANAARNFWRTLRNVYRQQRRWAYGSGDIPYFLFGFIKNKKIPFGKKLSLGLELVENHWSWATASVMIFILGWLPLLLGGFDFNQSLLSYNLPKMISYIMTFSMIGIVVSCYFSILLLPPKPPQYGRFKILVFAFGWFFVPLIMVFFTAFPALEAQTKWFFGRYMGFWATEKTRHTPGNSKFQIPNSK